MLCVGLCVGFSMGLATGQIASGTLKKWLAVRRVIAELDREIAADNLEVAREEGRNLQRAVLARNERSIGALE